MTITEKLIKIQWALKAPKNQYNKFGKYYYRNNEDIMEALKPLLKEYKCAVKQSDEIVQIGERYYVRAITELFDNESSVSAIGYAREEETKKGMDGSQITGAASSYARKYSADGLFALDDNKDADSQKSEKEPESKKELTQAEKLEKLSKFLGDKTSSIRTKEAFNECYNKFSQAPWWEENQKYCENWMQTFKNQLELTLEEMEKHGLNK